MDDINVFALCYIVFHCFAVIQTVGGRSKQARVTLFASMSPVSIWKKPMTVASTALLFSMEVNFGLRVNTLLISWQVGIRGGWSGNHRSPGRGWTMDWTDHACCTCLQWPMQSANELIRGTVGTLATNTKLMHWPVPHV